MMRHRFITTFNRLCAHLGLRVDQMKESDPIPTTLAEIAEIFRRGGYLSNREIYEKDAQIIDSLRDAALSPDPDQQAYFREQITHGDYWLSMGALADVSFTDRERHGRFVRAYLALANACESAGLGSIYSRSLRDIFGKWISEGVV